MLRRAAKVRVLSTIISLPAALRKDFVHLSCSRKKRACFLELREVEKRVRERNLARVSFHFELSKAFLLVQLSPRSGKE